MNDKLKKSLLTIGMPVYNGEDTIEQALEALLAQTFQDFQIVISDNASSDGTVAICERLASRDQRITLVRQKENKGATENFLYLLRMVDSEFFMWAAADDIWLSEFLERCMERFFDDPEVMFAMSEFKSISRTSRVFNKSFPNLLSFIGEKSPERRVSLYQNIPYTAQKDNLVYSVWKTDFLRGVVDDFQSSSSCFTIGGEMNEFALRNGKGAFVNEVLFYKIYRITPPGHLFDRVKSAVNKFKAKVYI